MADPPQSGYGAPTIAQGIEQQVTVYQIAPPQPATIVDNSGDTFDVATDNSPPDPNTDYVQVPAGVMDDPSAPQWYDFYDVGDIPPGWPIPLVNESTYGTQIGTDANGNPIIDISPGGILTSPDGVVVIYNTVAVGAGGGNPLSASKVTISAALPRPSVLNHATQDAAALDPYASMKYVFDQLSVGFSSLHRYFQAVAQEAHRTQTLTTNPTTERAWNPQ
jgi:hypothetical protein